MASKRTKKTLGRAGVGIAVVAVVAVGLLGYKAAAGTSTTNHYRTVTAGSGTVTQVLALSGTVHHVSQSSVSFPTSGVVTAVNVKAGDTVTAGQALASINSTPLQNAVLAADAAYKAAVSQYETDQQTYASSSSSSATKAATTAASHAPTATSSGSSSGGPSSTGTPSGGASGGPGGGATDPAAAVKAATDAITALQGGVQAFETALPIFISQCIPLIPTTTAVPTATKTVTETVTATVTSTVTVTVTAAASTSGTASTSSTAATSAASSAATSSTPSASASSTPTSSGSSAVPPACQSAIDTLTASQSTLPTQMTAANVTLAAAVKALTAQAATLQAQADALQKQSAQAAAAAAAAAAARSQSSSLTSTNSALQAAAAAGLSRTGGGTVDAATLITDQATIQSSAILLATAQDQLAQATMTSPIAGKVASMPFVVGQQTSATATAVIIGTGAIEVTVPVPLAKRAQVSTGQAATITSTIGGTTLTGTISRISLLPTTTTSNFGAAAAAGAAAATSASSSSTSSTTYGTVITVASGGDALPETSRVGATITTRTVNAAVVLPASAVTPTGTGSGTVQVVTNGILSTKRVVTGATGESMIEIVSGVTPGETVVIADVDKPIPGASIAASRGVQSAQQQQQQPQEFPTGGAAPGGAPPS